MGRAVFLSHSTKDAKVAGDICRYLEARNILCWIAPRDIEPGQDWPQAIVNAITECRVMIVIFSENANGSKNVARELERADRLDKAIIPVRISAVEPGEKLSYFITSTQWLDVVQAPLEDRLAELARRLLGILGPTTALQSVQQTGRSKLVQRLLDASSDLPTFLNTLATTQAVVVAGTEAAAFLVARRGETTELNLAVHIRPDESDAATRAAAIRAFQDIIGPCLKQDKDGAMEVGAPDAGEPQFCLVTLHRENGVAVAVSAVVTRCKGVERAKQRLLSMQLVAGYFEVYSLRRTLDSLRHALRA